jgi:ABC-type transporter Mla subunit MlaD
VFEEPNKPLSDEINRSLAEVIDSVTAVADSTAEIVEKLSSLVVRNEGRDELFHREIRQAQSYLIEFRHKMESVNKDQLSSGIQLDNVLTSTAAILIKVEELNKDLTRYLFESKDQLWERYQRISDVFSTQVADLKRIHEEMQDRAIRLGQYQADTVSRLDLISNIVKSCDASLSAMNRNLPQDLAEALESTHEQRLASLEAKMDKLLKIAYKESGKDDEGKDPDGFTKFGRWVLDNVKQAAGKVFAEILIFLLLWFYFMSGKIDSALSNAIRQPIQQVTTQQQPEKDPEPRSRPEMPGTKRPTR